MDTMEDVLHRIALFLDGDRSIIRCQSRHQWAKNSHSQISQLVQSLGYCVSEIYDNQISMSSITCMGDQSCDYPSLVEDPIVHSAYSENLKVGIIAAEGKDAVIIFSCMSFDDDYIMTHYAATKYIFIQSGIPPPAASDPLCRIGFEIEPKHWKYLYDDEYREFFVFYLVLHRLNVYLHSAIQSRILHYLRYTQDRCRRRSECVCKGEAIECSGRPDVRITLENMLKRRQINTVLAVVQSKRWRPLLVRNPMNCPDCILCGTCVLQLRLPYMSENIISLYENNERIKHLEDQLKEREGEISNLKAQNHQNVMDKQVQEKLELIVGRLSWYIKKIGFSLTEALGKTPKKDLSE